MKKIILFGLMALAVLVLAGCSNNVTGNAAAGSEEIVGGNVEIPLSEISETAKFYTYNDRGVSISYFVVLGSDGEPRTAFDACDVCGGYKGYQQIGTDIKCRNCGRVFSIDGLGTKNKGYGCWPSFLPHYVEDGKVIIRVSDIQEGRKRFV